MFRDGRFPRRVRIAKARARGDARLVVPVEVETEAELLMGASQLMIDASGTKTKIPVDNPHSNKYRIISTPHL